MPNSSAQQTSKAPNLRTSGQKVLRSPGQKVLRSSGREVLRSSGAMAASLQPTIAVLGATGGCGRVVVAAALARGRVVQALVHNPEKLTKHVPEVVGLDGKIVNEVSVVQGDASNPAVLRRAVEGVNVVVSCIGAASRNDTIMSVTAGHLLDT